MSAESTGAWDRVRIEPSDSENGIANLFCMAGEHRSPDIAIARLPMSVAPTKSAIMSDKNWVFMLDCMAEINERVGRGRSVQVETSAGDSWEHTI